MPMKTEQLKEIVKEFERHNKEFNYPVTSKKKKKKKKSEQNK